MTDENMAGSRFRAARHARQTHEVVMNAVQMIVFSEHPTRPAIGTNNLNSCTAVAIVSPYAAILAHIPPQPYPTDDPHLGWRNVEDRMSRVISLYRHNPGCFPPQRTYSIVVGAMYGGRLAVQDQVTGICAILRQSYLEPALEVYQVSNGGHPNPAQGTVFVDARSGPPVVYVEDHTITG